jgi:hypothetical protein
VLTSSSELLALHVTLLEQHLRLQARLKASVSGVTHYRNKFLEYRANLDSQLTSSQLTSSKLQCQVRQTRGSNCTGRSHCSLYRRSRIPWILLLHRRQSPLYTPASRLVSVTVERPLWSPVRSRRQAAAPQATYDPFGSGGVILRQDSRPTSVSGGLSGSTFKDP